MVPPSSFYARVAAAARRVLADWRGASWRV